MYSEQSKSPISSPSHVIIPRIRQFDPLTSCETCKERLKSAIIGLEDRKCSRPDGKLCKQSRRDQKDTGLTSTSSRI